VEESAVAQRRATTETWDSARHAGPVLNLPLIVAGDLAVEALVRFEALPARAAAGSADERQDRTLGFVVVLERPEVVGCHVVRPAEGGRMVRLEAVHAGGPGAGFRSWDELPWQPLARSPEDAYRLRLEIQRGAPSLVRCQAWPADEPAPPMAWGAEAQLPLQGAIRGVGLRTYRTAGRFEAVRIER
jgi:hypothetical protein